MTQKVSIITNLIIIIIFLWLPSPGLRVRGKDHTPVTGRPLTGSCHCNTKAWIYIISTPWLLRRAYPMQIEPAPVLGSAPHTGSAVPNASRSGPKFGTVFGTEPRTCTGSWKRTSEVQAPRAHVQGPRTQFLPLRC